jgi:glycosyltransferase involved in cell wall biosynthesis
VRVLLVSDFYPPAPGGLEAHVRRLAHELHRTGHKVAVVAGGPARPPVDDDGVTVHHPGLSLDRLPAAFREPAHRFHPPWPDRTFEHGVRRVLDRFAADVVHAHGWCQFSAAAAADGRVPVVVTLHDYGVNCPKKNLLRGDAECARGRGVRCLRCRGDEQPTAKRAVLSSALSRTVPRLTAQVDRFIAVSEHVARRFRETAPDPERVVVIPNFLDLPDELSAEPTGSQVLYVGPAARHKGLSVLLRALRQVPPGLAEAVVVGVSADEAVPAAESAPAAVRYAGRLTGEPLWRRFRAAAVVVVPSIWPEPCPTVALEALAFGRPVVASRIGGLPDLVADGSTGLLVPPGDPGALAAAMTTLLRDRSLLKAMAAAAYASAAAFATAAVVRRIEAVYTDAAAPRPPRRARRRR